MNPWLPHSHLSVQVGAMPAAVGAAPHISPAWALLSTVSLGLSAFHGYRRNHTVLSAVGWGLLGGAFPIIVPAIAFAQGFGKPA